MAGKPSFLLLPHLLFFSALWMLTSGGGLTLTPQPAVAVRSPPMQSSIASSAAEQKSIQFVRNKCRTTRYPRFCFTSLAAYSSSVQQSPLQLALVATNLTLNNLPPLSARVEALRRRGGSPRLAKALRDCADALGSAESEARGAAGEIRKLQGAGGGAKEVAWRVANAETWMSAALTNEETCTDGLTEVLGGDSPRTAEGVVVRRVWRAKKYTSNALALIDGLAATS